METLGQQFKTARERKKVSTSQAAAALRMKVQQLEALERDDFTKMPAPVYARGFIRLYAQYLELEAGPLLQEYMDLHGGQKKPSVLPATPLDNPKEQVPPMERMVTPPATIRPELTEAGRPSPWRLVFNHVNQKRIVLVAGLFLIGLLLVWSVRHGRTNRPVHPSPAAEVTTPPTPPPPTGQTIQEPPDPYLDKTLTPHSTP